MWANIQIQIRWNLCITILISTQQLLTTLSIAKATGLNYFHHKERGPIKDTSNTRDKFAQEIRSRIASNG